ncbi:MAG TPA: aspartate--tRNA ligase [Candidatus Dojkabacteria bacterium]|nr:aspartate--tRNA ligase [Candidatus Dojkabacteria bacterium]
MEMKRIYVKKTPEFVGSKVRVCGWASKVRDHGSLVFIDIRDWSGKLQLVLDSSKIKLSEKVGLEYVIDVIGTVKKREASMVNKNMELGDIEIEVEEIKILNASKTPPFPLDSDGEDIDESMRLKYRYIDIRRKRIRDLIELRHKMAMATRQWFTEAEFTEVQTPLLTVSSPEGARDYLVPSRIYPGKFYALPQAPQQYKQLLMVGGVDRYFQIAPCFRDEDPRADRHSGDFYQVDVETSFLTQQEFFETMEPYFSYLTEKLTTKKVQSKVFPQIPYNEAIDKYGTDKPDLRFDMYLIDLTDEFKKSGADIFKGIDCVKGILVDQEFSKKEIDKLTDEMKLEGAKGMVWLALENDVLSGTMAKLFPKKVQEEIIKKCKAAGYKKGKQYIFAFGDEYVKACKFAGILRNRMGEQLNLKDPNVLAFAWIVDFPMFEWDEKNKKWDFGHNPFSMPRGGLEALRNEKPEDIFAQQYDVACNGYELASGSVRNYHPESFIEAFKICGYTEEETRAKFGHMISAFEYGAPPHCGFAVGFDRFMMILSDEKNIKEVYAFPKSNAQELMTGAPREVDKSDLDVLGIELKKPVKK